MVVVGIDPGKKGGISILREGVDPTCLEMPLLSNGEINAVYIYTLLMTAMAHEASDSIVVMEKSQSMPGQGVKSTFSYGVGYGELRAVLKILQTPFQEIAPQKWKKEFSLIKKDKGESVVMASKLFPEITFHTDKGRMMDGKAESLLIAEYARRHYA